LSTGVGRHFIDNDRTKLTGTAPPLNFGKSDSLTTLNLVYQLK